MANFDLIYSYSSEIAEEFAEHGLPHPAVAPGNEMPSTDQLYQVLDELPHADYEPPTEPVDQLMVRDIEEDYGIAIASFDWLDRQSIPGDHFIVYGRGLITFEILLALSESCGPLVLYPDSGEPPVILSQGMDAQTVYELHQKAIEREDGCEWLTEQIYGRASKESGGQ